MTQRQATRSTDKGQMSETWLPFCYMNYAMHDGLHETGSYSRVNLGVVVYYHSH